MLVKVGIEGTSAMLQHRWNEGNEPDKPTRGVQEKRGTPREQAEKAAYRKNDKSIYFPSSSISRLLREAGGSHKQTGSRKSMKFVVPAAVLVPDEALDLIDPKTKKPLMDFEVDSRPVVIPATKGRIMRHRPRLDVWGAEFILDINEDLIEEKFVHQLLVEGGQRNGLGDFRPEHGGPFGRFRVTLWEKAA